MTRRGRRRGVFEGPPRVIYRRSGARYFEACAVGVVANGVAVSGFGVIVLALYVDVSVRELALFAACSAVGYAVEGVVAAVYLLRAAELARAWGGERIDMVCGAVRFDHSAARKLLAVLPRVLTFDPAARV